MKITAEDDLHTFVMDEASGWEFECTAINSVGGRQYNIIIATGPVGSGPMPSDFKLPPELREVEEFSIRENVG